MEECTERGRKNQVTDHCHAHLRIKAHLYDLTTVLSDFAVSPLTFVSMKEQNQLLLDQLALLWVCRSLRRIVSNSTWGTCWWKNDCEVVVFFIEGAKQLFVGLNY